MAFIFDRYAFDPASGVLRLVYGYDDGVRFEEVLTFPMPGDFDANAADKAFRLIWLLAGVSYYKARVPDAIICDGLDADTAQFLNKVYRLGLAEFAFRNGLTLNVQFNGAGEDAAPARLDVPQRLLVPVGGGKDSLVSVEALRNVADVHLFALGGPAGPAQPIAETMAIAGLPRVFVSRQLSPVLLQMNAGGAYNGHVPITAILSAIAVACAVLYGYSGVVMSNEHSASAPNFADVNHQYSKSMEFEADFAAYVARHVSPDIQYFSLLRPLTEVAIARRFARLPQYHAAFRSCNTAFRQDEQARGKKWCCNCPKCRFVFLALAPFVERARLVEIFGSNMLDDATQVDGFAALCGVSGYKPFECVGEVEESAAVMQRLYADPAWRDDAVVAALGPQTAGDFDGLFALRDGHAVPPEYLKVLDEGV